MNGTNYGMSDTGCPRIGRCLFRFQDRPDLRFETREGSSFPTAGAIGLVFPKSLGLTRLPIEGFPFNGIRDDHVAFDQAPA